MREAGGMRRTQFMAECLPGALHRAGERTGEDVNSTWQGVAQRGLSGRCDTQSLVRSVFPQLFINSLVGASPCAIYTAYREVNKT